MADEFGIMAAGSSPLAGVSPDVASRILRTQEIGMQQALQTLMGLEQMEQAADLQSAKIQREKEAQILDIADKTQRAAAERASREAIAASQQQTQRDIAAAKNITEMKKIALDRAKFTHKQDIYDAIPEEMTIDTDAGTMSLKDWVGMAEVGQAPKAVDEETRIYEVFAKPDGTVMALGTRGGEMVVEELDQLKGAKRQPMKETVEKLTPYEKRAQTEKAEVQAAISKPDYIDKLTKRLAETNMKVYRGLMSKDPAKREESKIVVRQEVVKDIADAWNIPVTDVKLAQDPKTGEIAFYRKGPGGEAIRVRGDI